MLRPVLATLEFLDQDQEKTKPVPDGEQSDRFDRADQDARAPTAVEAQLDLTV